MFLGGVKLPLHTLCSLHRAKTFENFSELARIFIRAIARSIAARKSLRSVILTTCTCCSCTEQELHASQEKPCTIKSTSPLHLPTLTRNSLTLIPLHIHLIVNIHILIHVSVHPLAKFAKCCNATKISYSKVHYYSFT